MSNDTIVLNSFLQSCQHRITSQLKKHLPPISQIPQRLHSAMHYAVFNGGKRLRPLLVYATGNALQIPLENLDLPAVAIELIHCYSLVHDDLPAMDNDDWRRGQPTCHKAFDEATAILVGDALQSLAFSCLTNIDMVNTLAKASGSYGMAGGQNLDLEAENQTTSLLELEHIHRLKTGALIEASVELGAIAAGYIQEPARIMLKKFAQNIGLAFQIQDDILDVEGSTQHLGKTAGIDAANKKATYTSILGVPEAKRLLQKHYEIAMNSLDQLTFDTSDLKQLCTYVVSRKN